MRKDSGFTLIETMVTLTIVSVAILATISTIVSVQHMNYDVEERTAALTGIQETIEKIRAENFANVYSSYNGYEFSITGLTPVPGFTTNNKAGKVTIDNSNPSLLDLTLQVQWKGYFGNRALTIRTLLTNLAEGS